MASTANKTFFPSHGNPVVFGVGLTICSVGMIGNGILFLTLLSYAPLRKSSSFPLMANCVVTDLLCGIVTGPVGLTTRYLGPQYQAPPWFCTVVYPLLVYTPPYARNFGMCCIAMHRLLGVIAPRLFQNITTGDLVVVRRVNTVCVTLPWLASLVMQVFPALRLGLAFLRQASSAGCILFSTTSSNISVLLYNVSGVCLPSVLTGVCYTILLATTAAKRRKAKNSNNATVVNGLNRRMDISRALVFSFIWHCISSYGLHAVTAFRTPSWNNVIVGNVLGLMLNIYSPINPVIYWLICKPFRDGLLQMLSKGRRTRVGPADAMM